MSSKGILQWLRQEGPHAPKHSEWKHPVVVLFLHYALVIAGSFAAHDWMIAKYQQVFYNNSNYHDADVDSDRPQECQAALSSSSSSSSSMSSTQQYIAIFLYGYWVWLMAWRLVTFKPQILANCVIYECTWLCNVSLIIGALVLQTNRPILAAAYCVTVGIDQLLWYVDLSVYFLFGTFPIGVCKYLFWPDTTFWTRFTCTHHLWTIPLLLYATHGAMHILALPLSFLCMTMNVVLSRCMIPFNAVAVVAATEATKEKEEAVQTLSNSKLQQQQAEQSIKLLGATTAKDNNDDSASTTSTDSSTSSTANHKTSSTSSQTPPPSSKSAPVGSDSKKSATAVTDEQQQLHNKYLNVNLSHELWRDIRIPLLQINYDDPPALLYLFRLLWRWQGFNTIVFGILYGICRLCFGPIPSPIISC